MAFRVGQKVVCVPDPKGFSGTGKGNTVEGRIYTIRDIDYRIVQFGGPVALRFEEIAGEIVKLAKHFGGGEWEVASDARHYRAILSTDTGMAILEQVRRDVTNKELRPIFEDEQA